MSTPAERNTTACTYYPGERIDLLPYLDVRGRSVLDIGCGAGGLAVHLRRLGAVEVVGVEPSDLAGEAAIHCDSVHQAAIEDIVEDIDRQFDVIVAADVLEHLVDPWTALAQLRPLLADDGMLLVSIPNVANLRILLRLAFRRDWRFDESGLFDRTHLRWFGRNSLHRMLVGAGFEPQVWGANAGVLLSGWRWERPISPRWLRFLPSYLVEQWVVVCHAADLAPVSTDPRWPSCNPPGTPDQGVGADGRSSAGSRREPEQQSTVRGEAHE